MIKITLGGAFGDKLPNKNPVNKSSESDKILSRYLSMFQKSWDYAKDNYHKRWENNWKLYRNERVKRCHDGIVETFVPMVNSTVNTIVASLFNSNPSVKYIPNHPDQEADTKILSEIYADFGRRDGWTQKNKVNGRQGIITGNLCAYYEWKDDPSGGYVHKINIPVRDMIIDPSSHGIHDCAYVGRRFFVSKKSLEADKVYNPKLQKYVNRYSNLDNINSTGSSDADDKKIKEQSVGSISKSKNQIEIIEIWTREKVATIANRSVLLEYIDNPYLQIAKAKYAQKKIENELLEAQGSVVEKLPDFDAKSMGILPFAHGRMYEDISLPYSDSDVDIIADQQELLNELTELSIEASLYTVYPERTVDPKFSTMADAFDPVPGRTYFVPHGAMSWNTPPQIPANIFNERMTVKDEIREAIAVSQISKGVSATDNTTATEIKATLGRADTRIQEKAQTLANDFFMQEATIVFKMIQLYISEKTWVRTMQDAGVSFSELDPSAFIGEYTPMVTLDVQKRLEEAEVRESYLQAYQMLISDPTNNLEAVKRHCLPKILTDMTKEQIDEILSKPSPEQLEMPQEDSAEEGQAIPEENMPANPQELGENLNNGGLNE